MAVAQRLKKIQMNTPVNPSSGDSAGEVNSRIRAYVLTMDFVIFSSRPPTYSIPSHEVPGLGLVQEQILLAIETNNNTPGTSWLRNAMAPRAVKSTSRNSSK